jgi:hypothetical protein
METVKLSKDELVKLIGLKKAKKTYPDMFKDEQAMHEITFENVGKMIEISTEETAPAAKYAAKSFVLSTDYHWSIIKRVVNGSFNTYLVPISKEYSRHNPLNKLRTAANFGKVKKVAAKRKGRPRKTEE